MKKIVYSCDKGLAGYEALALAIIEQACEDYERALKKKDNEKIIILEKFFRSQWYCFLSRIDGEYLIMKIKEKYNNDSVKKSNSKSIARRNTKKNIDSK